MRPSLASEVVLTWFGASMFIHVMSGAVLCLWLRFLSLANTVVSAVIAIPMMTSPPYPG